MLARPENLTGRMIGLIRLALEPLRGLMPVVTIRAVLERCRSGRTGSGFGMRPALLSARWRGLKTAPAAWSGWSGSPSSRFVGW